MRIRDRRNGSEPKEKMINPKAETLLKPAQKITRVRGNQAGISNPVGTLFLSSTHTTVLPLNHYLSLQISLQITINLSYLCDVDELL